MKYSPAPIAKVEYMSTRFNGDGFHKATPYAWVSVLEVYDSLRFEKEALKISEDGERANLSISEGAVFESGKTYYVYPVRKSGSTLEAKRTWRYRLLEKFLHWLLLGAGCYLFLSALADYRSRKDGV